MDSPNLNNLQSAIKSVFCRWEKISTLSDEFRIVDVLDITQNRYQLQHLEQKNNSYLMDTCLFRNPRGKNLD
jgi:hypothetical protein